LECVVDGETFSRRHRRIPPNRPAASATPMHQQLFTRRLYVLRLYTHGAAYGSSGGAQNKMNYVFYLHAGTENLCHYSGGYCGDGHACVAEEGKQRLVQHSNSPASEDREL